jgi:adenine-specific DNA-methyltransferase
MINLPKKTTKSIKHPLPMQYMGSKLRIADWIMDEIEANFGEKCTFVDLMSGTGAIAHHANLRGYEIVANDIQPYSFLILKSLFVDDKSGIDSIIDSLKKVDVSTLLSNRDHAEANLNKEKEFELNYKKDDFDWEAYKKFCDQTVMSTIGSSKKFDLFSRYYPNTYFGIRQCLELDAIQKIAHNLPEPLRTHVIAATVSTMTYLVSSTTHLAQYLKPSSRLTAQHLIRRRSMRIIDHTIERLESLKDYPTPIKSQVYNLDYKALLKNSSIKKGVVYADPPYFKEHYSRYYHLLDTFALYDFPELTFNGRINEVTVGRYRNDRIVSDFGLKSKVSHAFDELFRLSSLKLLDVALSYANTSLLDSDAIIKLAKKYNYSCRLKEISLMHSGQGQATRNKQVTEYLFLFKYGS